MTNSPLQPVSVSSPARVRLPASTGALFVLGPFLLVLGAFVANVNANRDYDWVLYPTMIGWIIFALGIAATTTAFVYVGLRGLAQQQVDLLLHARNDG